MNFSICIPIFNQLPTNLVKVLSIQASKLAADIEILIVDDGSSIEEVTLNEALLEIPLVNIEKLPKNIGRSAIRNHLAQKASGEFLLFLDGDSEIINDDFIVNYLNATNNKVVVGGRVYSDSITEDYKLHWTYGRKIESKKAKVRSLAPWANFHSNNFMVEKSSFLKILFDEKLSQYGHEDTLFGFNLELLNIPVHHIDNEVLHGQLEDNYTFINKTEKGLENLLLIHSHYPNFSTKSRLLQTFLKIKRFKMIWIFSVIFQLKRKAWLSSLTKKDSSLAIFNWYKLTYLCSISSTK